MWRSFNSVDDDSKTNVLLHPLARSYFSMLGLLCLGPRLGLYRLLLLQCGPRDLTPERIVKQRINLVRSRSTPLAFLARSGRRGRIRCRRMIRHFLSRMGALYSWSWSRLIRPGLG